MRTTEARAPAEDVEALAWPGDPEDTAEALEGLANDIHGWCNGEPCLPEDRPNMTDGDIVRAGAAHIRDLSRKLERLGQRYSAQVGHSLKRTTCLTPRPRWRRRDRSGRSLRMRPTSAPTTWRPSFGTATAIPTFMCLNSTGSTGT